VDGHFTAVERSSTRSAKQASVPSPDSRRPQPPPPVSLPADAHGTLTRPRNGARLFWTSEGQGAPAVLLCDGLGCDGFIWRYLEPALAEERKVVHWHYPAHGRSPPPSHSHGFSLPHLADDAVTVLDAARLQRVVVVGHSMGVQVALEMHHRHRARVEALILVCGSPGHPLDTFHDTSVLRWLLPSLRKTTEALPRGVSALTRAAVRSGLALELALLFEVNAKLVHREDLEPYFAHFLSMDPRLFLRTMQAAAEHSAEDYLPQVDVPTLVIGGDHDRFTPPWLSRRMALAIPDAELVMVPGGSHTTPLEAPETVQQAVADFLRKRVSACDIGAPPA
jgi:pimeloyl-ACP methyl ester carboxylesterase